MNPFVVLFSLFISVTRPHHPMIDHKDLQQKQRVQRFNWNKWREVDFEVLLLIDKVMLPLLTPQAHGKPLLCHRGFMVCSKECDGEALSDWLDKDKWLEAFTFAYMFLSS